MRLFGGSGEHPTLPPHKSIRAAIVETIVNALRLGRETRLFDHEAEPTSAVAFGVVDQ
jgi:hypothetical protein